MSYNVTEEQDIALFIGSLLHFSVQIRNKHQFVNKQGGNVCCSATSVQTEVSQQILDGLP